MCPHKHNYIYICQNNFNNFKAIILKIDDILFEIPIKKYPCFKDKLIMSTMVKNEDSYILQWINFYITLGIDNFIIYDNSESDNTRYHSIEKSSNLKIKLEELINNGLVILIKWKYPKYLKKSGISGQTTQQNHSLHAFKTSKLIGFFDIDEYFNPLKSNSIQEAFDSIITKNNIDINTIGGFQICNKFFYNSKNLPTENYNFLQITNCKEQSKNNYHNNHQKCFIIPRNVNIFSIHRITDGKKIYICDHTDVIFNHYYFLNKKNRGNDSTTLYDDSILRFIPRLPTLTKANNKSINKYSPCLANEDLKLFKHYLDKSNFYLEYGSGGSTIEASLHSNIKHIYSIESDLQWYSLVKKQINDIKHVTLKYIDMKTKPNTWGFPGSTSTKDDWLNYSNELYNCVFLSNLDLILIDGRFRVATCLKCFSKIQKNCKIFFDDFLNRKHYHIILDYFEILQSTSNNRAVIMIKKNNVSEPTRELISKYENDKR